MESEQKKKKTTTVVNEDPSFGSALLMDDFRPRLIDADDDDDDDDDLKARLDPLKLEAVAEKRLTSEEDDGYEEDASQLDPLLRNPNGATHIFTDMHGVSSLEVEEDAPDLDGPAKTGMRHMAGLTVGAQRLGVTDWGSGTDGGSSGKPRDGVPYGSFVGA